MQPVGEQKKNPAITAKWEQEEKNKKKRHKRQYKPGRVKNFKQGHGEE